MQDECCGNCKYFHLQEGEPSGKCMYPVNEDLIETRIADALSIPLDIIAVFVNRDVKPTYGKNCLCHKPIETKEEAIGL